MFGSLRSFLPVTVATLLVLLTAGPRLQAEGDSGGLYETLNSRPPLFGGRFAPGPRIITVPEEQVRTPRRRVLEPRLRNADSALPNAAEVRPKVDPTTFILVLGDSLGDLLGSGLDEAMADVPTAAVIRKTRANSGLVRDDFHDWPKTVRDLLASEQKVSLGVMLVGANDRQPLREGDMIHEPLSERWRELYRDRIDAVAQAFAERRIPLIWVGAPPMQNQRLSADLVTLNELFRQRAERAGAIYVDLWQAFVDGENRYSASGPDLSGQLSRLRTGDGVHFTRAGARKAAHFADVAARRLLPDISAGPQVALPTPAPLPGPEPAPGTAAPAGVAALPLELQPGGVERLIDQMARLGHGLDPIPLPALPVKPEAGPVLPLTGPALAPGGLLLATPVAARGSGAKAAELDRVFGEGRLPPATAGRADDFRWPRAP